MTQTAAAPKKPKAKDPAGPLKREAKRLRGAVDAVNTALARAREAGLTIDLMVAFTGAHETAGGQFEGESCAVTHLGSALGVEIEKIDAKLTL